MRVVLLALLLLPGCSALKDGFGGEQADKPLLEQILIMVPGHAGLVNQICRKRTWFGECPEENMSRVEYSLDDAEMRGNLIKLDFICLIAGKHYFINPKAAEFIRITWKRECWLCDKDPVISERIPFEKTQFLIDSATTCWSRKTYPNGVK